MSELFSHASRPQSPLDELIETMRILLDEGGCPWDREQTHESLAKYLIEESAELVDAIEEGTAKDVKEELGDVLYQLLFHAQIAANAGEGYDIQDVAAATNEKMRRRHPHVFGDDPAHTNEEIEAMWARVKAQEKAERTSVLDGVPMNLPALALADKVIGRAASLGLVPGGAEAGIPLESEEQLGGLLLAIVASARAQGLEAERALRRTVKALAGEVRQAEWQASDAGVVGVVRDAETDAPGASPDGGADSGAGKTGAESA
ncbi:MAG TPA: MazG family protein [Pseudoclavibacter sp.]|nr:MazG family protein [Pseudoclavibacter sp.]